MNQCDQGHETKEEIRSLPIGGQGNILVCKEHYRKEIEFRKYRILEGVPFDLPKWEALKVYY
mgnify:CR=1 FL=1